MSTLTYWICDCLDDRPNFSIRARTRRECVEAREAMGEHASSFGKPRKVEIRYTDAFSLMIRLLGEGSAESA